MKKTLLLASILLALFLWKTPLWTQDGPPHKKVAVTLARLSGNLAENAVYKSTLKPFQTNALFPLLYLPLAKFLDVDTYEKIYFGLMLFLLALSYLTFLSVWSPQNISLWVLILPFWFHPLFIRGMYNFMASVPLTLLALTFLRQGLQTKKWFYPLLFFFCYWVAFLAHPFPAILVPLCIVLLAFGEFKTDFKYCVSYGMIALLFLILGFIIPLAESTPPGFSTPYIFLPLPVALGGLFVFNFVGYSIWEFVLFLPFFAMLMWLMVHSAKTCSWKQKIFWCVFLLAYLIFPRIGSGGAHLNERFLPFLWCFLPIGLSLKVRQIRWVQGLSMVTTLAVAICVFFGMKKMDAAAQEARMVLQSLPNQSRLYPINFDVNGPAVNYTGLTHLWAVYEDDRTIFTPYLFALEPLSRKRFSSETYFPATEELFPKKMASAELCQHRTISETINCSTARQEAYQKVFTKAAYYDYWFLHSPPPQFLDFLSTLPGLKKVAQAGDSSLWHYEKAKPFDPPL